MRQAARRCPSWLVGAAVVVLGAVSVCVPASRSSWVSIGWGAGSWLQLPLCRFVRPAHNGGVARAAVLFFACVWGAGVHADFTRAHSVFPWLALASAQVGLCQGR